MYQEPRLPQGPGRPKKPPGTHKVNLRVTVPPDIADWAWEEAARTKDGVLSDLVTEALELLRDRRNETPPPD